VKKVLLFFKISLNHLDRKFKIQMDIFLFVAKPVKTTYITERHIFDRAMWVAKSQTE